MPPDAEDQISAFLRKVLVTVGLWIAAPFFALALTFVLMQRPWWWALIPASIGALLLATALVVWLVARARLRALGAAIDLAADNDIGRPPRAP